MAAVNLLYVIKDGVFNCYDQLTGFTKASYTIIDKPATIKDTLTGDCVLVLPSHCNEKAGVTLGGKKLSVSAYADAILAGITDGAKIKKVVYLVCWGTVTVKPRAFDQLTPDGELTLTPQGLIVTGAGNTTITPKAAVNAAATGNGWTFTARTPA